MDRESASAGGVETLESAAAESESAGLCECRRKSEIYSNFQVIVGLISVSGLTRTRTIFEKGQKSEPEPDPFAN
ncbi:hypothetical protein KFK09_025107 [Dendrobium nobile]|uniref:Uncharacterized protein n=1 Tax=Dendrobium nobile TaxID=94219 RepID=A0A8T3AG06_DENNO|nr:hypothetical protein KFK09_025107 [Dendrobium nobile]